MKNVCAKLLMVAIVGVMLAAAGCVYDESDLVITEQVCVNFDQTITTGSFSTFVVCDKFRETLLVELAAHNKTLDDIESIHMVSGTFKTMAVTGARRHDWFVTADVSIARQDDPGDPVTDGPASFVSFDNQSLQALKGAPTDADLHSDGVELVNRALQALLDGENPRLVLVVDNGSISPTPSTSDPMDFKLLTCVKFQAIVDMSDPE